MTDHKYGAVWAPRKMNKGDIFRKVCDVYWYSRSGIFLHADIYVASYIKLLDHYDSFKTSNGATYNDVIKLTWLFAPTDTPTEIYYYAKGVGLVEFQGPDHHSAAAPGTPQFPPQREVLAWFDESKPYYAPAPVQEPEPTPEPAPEYPDPDHARPVLYGTVTRGGIYTRTEPGAPGEAASLTAA